MRVEKGKNMLSFGVSYLDEFLGGIAMNDLILYGATTGIGKTALATITAVANAEKGKRVHFFALEAEENEIENRIRYQILANFFFQQGMFKQYQGVRLNYMDWFYGKLDKDIAILEDELDLVMPDKLQGLHTIYTNEAFTIEEFQRYFLAIKGQTDLVIIDHLHFFDIEDDNENRGMKKIVKSIRSLSLELGVPVIMISHMRKIDWRAKQIVPGLNDFHGSSDITKMATKVVTLAPAPVLDSTQPGVLPTYIRAAKCRVEGLRTRLTALIGFHNDNMKYARQYFLGRLNLSESEFKPITKVVEIPPWANGGIPHPEVEEGKEK